MWESLLKRSINGRDAGRIVGIGRRVQRAVDREWIKVNYSGTWPLKLQAVPAMALVLLLLPAGMSYPYSWPLTQGLAIVGVAASLLSACWVQWRWYVGGPCSSSLRRQRAWHRRANRAER